MLDITYVAFPFTIAAIVIALLNDMKIKKLEKRTEEIERKN